MNRPVSLLWLEGMDPQCLTALPSLSLFALHGCDLQLKSVPLLEQEQCSYQFLTGMGPGQFGRFDALRVDNYQAYVNDGLPSGAIDRLLPDVVRQQGLRVLSVEIRSLSELASLTLHEYDFTLIRVLAADMFSFSALNALVQFWLVSLPAAQCLVLTDVFFSPVTTPVNVNDFLASLGLLKYDEHLAISWPETLAYGLGTGQLWLNMRGREAQGRVRPGSEFRKISEMLMHELVRWHDPMNDKPIIETVLTKEKAYRGEYVFKAPDLTLLYRSGYRPSANAYALRVDGVSVLPAIHAEIVESAYTGYARLLASGPALQHGVSAHASLLDVFPLVLYLLGLPLPRRLEGKVVPALFLEEQFARAPIVYEDHEDELLADEDEHSILTRLRDLGYLG